MKGNTQLPQFPEPTEEVVVVAGDVVVVVVKLLVVVVVIVVVVVVGAPPSYGGQVDRSGICWFSQSVKWETSE